MLDQDCPRDSEGLGKRRTATLPTAMGSVTLLARPFRDIPDETGRRVPKVMIGRQALCRSDITEGKLGIPLTLILVLVDATDGATRIAGANVEIWHCDADGVYSEYASKIEPDGATTTYLRGFQTTDEAGRVIFGTIYPGWIDARAPHIYVRIYDGLTPKRSVVLGFPDAVSAAVYSDGERYVRGQNPTRNATDPWFGGGVLGNSAKRGEGEFQIAPVAGDNASGYVVMLAIEVQNFI
jgi:Dioxygenase